MNRMFLFTMVFLASFIALASGCVGRANSWDPESRMLTLYGPSQIEIPARYTYAGGMMASVVGEGDVATRIPHDTFRTDVFTADGSVMLAQRLSKFDRYYKFRFLGGEKAEAWGQTWRVGNYALDTEAPDTEFAQYLGFLRDHGVILPGKVRVQMLDKLSGDFIVLRVVTLLYDAEHGSVEGLEPLPPFRKLYDQEQAYDPFDTRIVP